METSEQSSSDLYLQTNQQQHQAVYLMPGRWKLIISKTTTSRLNKQHSGCHPNISVIDHPASGDRKSDAHARFFDPHKSSSTSLDYSLIRANQCTSTANEILGSRRETQRVQAVAMANRDHGTAGCRWLFVLSFVAFSR